MSAFLRVLNQHGELLLVSRPPSAERLAYGMSATVATSTTIPSRLRISLASAPLRSCGEIGLVRLGPTALRIQRTSPHALLLLQIKSLT